MSPSSKDYPMGLKMGEGHAANVRQPRLPVPEVTFTADDQGSCLHRLTRVPHLVPGTPSLRPARAASLLPFSASNGARGSARQTHPHLGPKGDADASWAGG